MKKSMKFTKIKKPDPNDAEDFEEPKKWYETLAEDPKEFPKSTEQVLIDLKEEAKKCHDTEVANYNIKNSKTNPNYQWMKTVMKKGTVSDKTAAHVVMIQDDPVCCLETIRNLVGMVKVGKRKECLTVMDTLTDLFLSDILRPDRKLKPFHQRPLSLLNEMASGNAVTRRKLLSVWYFEDQLKETYTSFVLALNSVAHDTVDSNKEKAINVMYKLLSGNPEQEQNLLRNIVNKLGDPSRKVASKVIYCLTQLLLKHMNMQGVVLKEIEKLLFRPNITSKAQYYALCFLSQYHLSHEYSDVAQKLIEVYFSFFRACVKTGDVDTRMMSALLMGINRAYPYAKVEFQKISEHIDTMYRLVHMANFNISLHALMILYQVSDFGNNINDRFYGALYKKLLDPNLLTTTYRAMLLSLIYKAMLKDKELNRVKVFIKRLLQIAMYTQPCFSCGILYLISQLMSKRDNLQAFVLEPSQIEGLGDDDGDEKYYDVKEVEIKTEPDEQMDSNIVANANEISTDTVVEIKEEPEDVKPEVNSLEDSVNGASWHHCKNVKKEKRSHHFDPLARNPSYAGGEFCAYKELHSLRNHYHPTVSLYATNIINSENVKYSGDPLKDFTLIKFLERFVFKNPKKIQETIGIDPILGKRKLIRPRGVKALSVMSEGYLQEDSRNIPVDELFLHAYLHKKHEERGPKSADDSDVESVQSEEFEEMLDKMSGANETIDFMDEIGDSLKKRELAKNKDDDEVDDEELQSEDGDFGDEEGDDGLDDEEFLQEDEDLLADLTDDDDDDELEFHDEEKPTKYKKNKLPKTKDDISSLFASAEEFATLLEEEGSSKVKPGTSNVFSNKDNANMKQLAWEERRNRWVKGFDKGEMRGKKRMNEGKFGNRKKWAKK